MVYVIRTRMVPWSFVLVGGKSKAFNRRVRGERPQRTVRMALVRIMNALLLGSSQTAGAERAVVKPMQALGHTGAQQRVVADGEQVVGDEP